jgi:hypothetical protein
MAAVNPIPACPITGQSALRLIQSVSSDLLNGLWRASFGVATERQLGKGRRIGLWESRCGLVFFDPMIAGDGSFYRKLYPGWGKDGPWESQTAGRADYARAAAMVSGRLCGALLGTPRGAKPVELLLIARKPPAGMR